VNTRIFTEALKKLTILYKACHEPVSEDCGGFSTANKNNIGDK
jgi:hypothetical protein